MLIDGVKVHLLRNRAKVCKNKVSFNTCKHAVKVAKQYKQYVYECPDCYCFHLATNKEKRLYTQGEVTTLLKIREQQVREQLNKKLKTINCKLDEVYKELADYKKGDIP